MTALPPLLMGVAPPEWADVPWYQLVRRALLIVAGEVVHVDKPAAGVPVARLRVDATLKGKPEAPEIRVPFKTDCRWGGDFTLAYAPGKRYLLLIDEVSPFRVVYYPSGTRFEIDGLDAPAVRFMRMVLDIDAGRDLERRVPELLEVVRNGPYRDEALHVFRLVPREQARPHLDTVRAAYGTKYRQMLTQDFYRRYYLSRDAEITRDLSLVAELLAVEPNHEAYLLETLGLLTGRRCPSLKNFRAWWASVERRSRIRSRPDDARLWLSALESSDPRARETAVERLLDLGPDILDAVRARSAPADLIGELELMADLRAHLARATERP
ncbi:MAG TPA: hypothetical protein VEJ18_06040 [Planctomycetota bacterium]|nr:hypothetical protein [Planctomycetota bacterium]